MSVIFCYGTFMRASRLLSILILLQLRGRISAQVLADEHEVSVRTIYRDIDALSAAGIPVYGDSGPGGGFALLEGYRTGLSGLSAVEAQAMLLTGFPQALALTNLDAEAQSGRRKLLAASPRGVAVDPVAARIHLDPVGWYRRNPAAPLLATVAAAVFDGNRLAMRYDSWKGVVERTVDPEGLVLKSGAWYLVARVDGGPRTYRVSSILAAEHLAEPAARQPGFDLASYWAESSTRFEQSLHRSHATIRVAPQAMRDLKRLGDAMAGPLAAAEPDADGWRSAAISIETIEHAAALLLSLGPHFEVVAPSALRAKVAEFAAGIVALNE